MLKTQVEQAKGGAAVLERLYRGALTAGEESTFKEAIAQCVKEDPEDILSSAWAYRLDIQSAEAEEEVQVSKQDENRHWWTAIVGSVTLGILYALFAGDKAPVPVPGEANPLFWIGWAPLTALGVLFYLAVVDRTNERIRWYGGIRGERGCAYNA